MKSRRTKKEDLPRAFMYGVSYSSLYLLGVGECGVISGVGHALLDSGFLRSYTYSLFTVAQTPSIDPNMIVYAPVWPVGLHPNMM